MKNTKSLHKITLFLFIVLFIQYICFNSDYSFVFGFYKSTVYSKVQLHCISKNQHHIQNPLIDYTGLLYDAVPAAYPHWLLPQSKTPISSVTTLHSDWTVTVQPPLLTDGSTVTTLPLVAQSPCCCWQLATVTTMSLSSQRVVIRPYT